MILELSVTLLFPRFPAMPRTASVWFDVYITTIRYSFCKQQQRMAENKFWNSL